MMLGMKIRMGACLTATLLALPAAAMTAQEVIAKHIEARGGQENWDAVKSIRATGQFTAFSQVKPFTLTKQRDNNYHMDHMLGNRLVVIGFNGETAWWDNHWSQEGAQLIGGVNRTVLTRELDFINPLFDVEAKGYEVELLGEVDFEGMPAIGIKLNRGDESEETWYLDPETYLEIGRTSPGSDFGRPMEQRTFYDDFRDVQGVKIPFFTETQWYTRDRVMVIENLEINVEIDPTLFDMPAPLGMGSFQSLVGEWEVAVEERQQPGAPWQSRNRTSSIAGPLSGGLLQEEFSSTQGDPVIRTLSYDRFSKRYRLTQIDARRAQMDIREGELSEDGVLSVSNVDSGTSFETFGNIVNGRLSIKDIAKDSFTIEQEFSIDGGESWFVSVKSAYTRRVD